MMRKALDRLYGAALAAACLAMVAIAVLVLVQVGGRVIDRAADLVGLARPAISVPSLAEFGGYLFAASTFLALPATLRAGGHVRVTLALRGLPPGAQRAVAIAVVALALALALFAAHAIGAQTLTAFQRGSVSYGLIPIPLWIPQAFMTAGLAVFALALADEGVRMLRGREPAFREAERLREVQGEGH